MSVRIVLDPGHGKGSRPVYGCGASETDIVWNVAVLLKEMLEKNAFEVVLTKKNRDEDPRPSERGKFATRNKANIFVSLHCNAAVNNAKRRGVFGIFYGKNTRENTAPDNEILAPESRRLARFISQEISILTGIPLLGSEGARLWWKCPSNLAVLTGGNNWALTDASCLIEAGFLTNEEDRKIMVSEEGQKNYAMGCAMGISRYLGVSSGLEFDEVAELEPGEEPECEKEYYNRWTHELEGLLECKLDEFVTYRDLLRMLQKVYK